MILGGLLLVLFAGSGGIWLAPIGVFLVSAADREAQAGDAGTAISDLRVADVIVHDPVTVTPDLSIHRFMDDVFLAHRHASYPGGGEPPARPYRRKPVIEPDRGQPSRSGEKSVRC